MGFTDNPIPKSSDPIIYAGTDTRNDYTNWNVSTEILNKEIRANLYKTYLNPLTKDDHCLAEFQNEIREVFKRLREPSI